MYGHPGAIRLAENPRTAAKAAIKRGSKAARAKMRQLSRELLKQLESVYRRTAEDIRAYLQSRAGDDNTLRLEVMQDLLTQAESRLNLMAAERNGLLESGLLQAADIGVEPFQQAVDIGASLTRIADDAARFVTQFVAEDGLQLSNRIWKLDGQAREVVGDAIQQAVVRGWSASKAAQAFLSRAQAVPKEVQSQINAASATKVGEQILDGVMRSEGSAYSNAMRLFRTEINRAHGEAYQAAAFDHPDVIGTRFLLSPNHPRTDICDMHAKVNRYGLGPGVYPKGKNPWPAHPNTLSFVEVVFDDEVSEDDRKGKETRIDWLKRQDAGVQSDVLGARVKQAALKQGVLTEQEIATPWQILKKKYARKGIDIKGAIPGSKAPTTEGVQPDSSGVIIKTSFPEGFPVAENLPQANKIAKQYVTKGRAHHYPKEANGEFTIRFRHGPKFLPKQIREKKFNKISFSGLKVETANATNRMLHEVDQVAEKLGLPALRGVNTAAGQAAASMGDGVLAISKYNNRYFGTRMTQQEAIAHHKGLVKQKREILDKWLETYQGPASTKEQIKQAYLKDIQNLENRLKRLEQGVPVEVVTNPPSTWKPGSPDVAPALSDAYFSLPEEKYKSTIWHEFGHHIHQQLGVSDATSYQAPPLEADLLKLFKKPGRTFPTRYSRTNHKEWFAESYSLYRLGRSDLLDPDLLALIRQIESGEYTGGQ